MLSSPYLHAALLGLALSYGCWSVPGWWDLPISILPGLVSFTLAGYAMLIAVGDDTFRRVLTSKAVGASALRRISATFAHFILLQALALVLSVVAKSRPLESISALLPQDFHNQLLAEIRFYVGRTVWGAIYALFLYSLTSIASIAFAVFRVIGWFDTYMAASQPDDQK